MAIDSKAARVLPCAGESVAALVRYPIMHADHKTYTLHISLVRGRASMFSRRLSNPISWIR